MRPVDDGRESILRQDNAVAGRIEGRYDTSLLDAATDEKFHTSFVGSFLLLSSEPECYFIVPSNGPATQRSHRRAAVCPMHSVRRVINCDQR